MKKVVCGLLAMAMIIVMLPQISLADEEVLEPITEPGGEFVEQESTEATGKPSLTDLLGGEEVVIEPVSEDAVEVTEEETVSENITEGAPQEIAELASEEASEPESEVVEETESNEAAEPEDEVSKEDADSDENDAKDEESSDEAEEEEEIEDLDLEVEESLYADGTSGYYKPLAASSVVKDWNFESALNTSLSDSARNAIIVKYDETANPSRTDLLNQTMGGKTLKYGNEGFVVKIANGYKSYDSSLFDIYIKFTAGEGFDKAANVAWSGPGGNGGCCIRDNGTDSWLSFSAGTDGKTNFDYEIWLTKPGDSMELYETDELFITGSCYMAGDGSSGVEAARPWSWNNTLYSNSNLTYLKLNSGEAIDPEASDYNSTKTSKADKKFHWEYNATKKLWYSSREANTDQPYAFVIGYGYTTEHSVKGGYANGQISGGSGIAEILFGYRTRTVTFLPSQESLDNNQLNNTNSIGGAASISREYLEQSYTKESNPKDVPPVVTTTDASQYNFTYWTTKTDVKLKDGSTISAGEPITDKELTQLYVDKDLTFYAHTSTQPFNPKYTLKYESNGGTAFADEKYNRAEETNIIGSDGKFNNIPTRSGYIFEGWFYDEDLTQKVDSEIIMYDDEIVYAKWTPDIVKVTFDRNDNGPKNPDTQELIRGDKATNPSSFVKGQEYDGYIFEGWYEDGKDTPFDFSKPITKDTHLIAKWTPAKKDKTYTVKFDSHGGTTVSKQDKIPENNKVKEPKDPTRPGYTFKGWYTNKDGKGDPYDFNTPVNKNFTLHAVWEKEVYHVTYQPNNGDDSWTNGDLSYGDLTDAGKVPTREGYVFDGWYLDEKCTIPYDPSKPIDGNLKVYAKWLPKVILSFDTQVVDLTGPDAQELGKGKTGTEPQDPTRKGYIFKGWYDNPEGTGKPFDFNTPIEKDTTLYAIWERAKTVTTTTTTTTTRVVKSPKTMDSTTMMWFLPMLMLILGVGVALTFKRSYK